MIDERKFSPYKRFKEGDEQSLVSLWNVCKLTVPWNNPYKDIARKT